MRYTLLGRHTGLPVSELALGSGNFGMARGYGAEPAVVQRFIAYGQLCHLIVQAELTDLDDGWAETLTAGIRHNN